tara:strand:+ start:4156 stop:4716 length:561 start_codon:yes stop_codon:yes gene_type:complete
MRFQNIVVIISLILVVLTLSTVGYLIHTKKSKMEWPPIVGNCPDYWSDVKGDGSECVNTHRLGTCMMPSDTTYTKYENTNVTNNLESEKTQSIDDCTNKCTSSSSCMGYTYEQGICHLKKNTKNKYDSNGVNLFVKLKPESERVKSMNFSVSPYIGTNGLCSKYKWSKNCGITWDGITTLKDSPCT